MTKTNLIAAMAGLAMAMLSSGASGQSLLTGEAELRQKQAEQFQAMFDRPEDLDLMFAYALTSIRLKDFEAAISTLDRMLVFNPALVRVRLELAASYFRIGSYPIARHYFVQVVESPNADDTVKSRANEFLDIIDQRTRESYITGVIAANTIFTTNANNGPSTRDVIFRDQIVQLTGDDVTSQTDVGASLGAQLTHVYDLGGETEDSWRTNVALYSQRFSSTGDGAADVVVLRTGPQLSVDDDRYGVKVRPFVEFDHVRSSNDALFTTLGGGFEIQNTVDSKLTLSGDLRLAYRDYHSNNDLDGLTIRGAGTARYFFNDDLSFRARALFEYDGAEERPERSYEVGAEGAIIYRYSSGFEFSTRRWVAAGTLRTVYRRFDEPGTGEGDSMKTRQDVDLRVGLSNTAYIGAGWSLLTKADYFIRESNVQNFDLDSFTLSVGAQFNF